MADDEIYKNLLIIYNQIVLAGGNAPRLYESTCTARWDFTNVLLNPSPSDIPEEFLYQSTFH